jgi:hypothetical protein
MERTLFLFIFMSDGEDTENTEEELQNTFDTYSKYITGSGIRSVSNPYNKVITIVYIQGRWYRKRCGYSSRHES